MPSNGKGYGSLPEQRDYAKKKIASDEFDSSMSPAEKKRRRALFDRVIQRSDANIGKEGGGSESGSKLDGLMALFKMGKGLAKLPGKEKKNLGKVAGY